MWFAANTDMASSAFSHCCSMAPVCTMSPVWTTIFPLKRAQLSTIQLFDILNRAGFDSERNCVSVIQKIEKASAAGASAGPDVADSAEVDEGVAVWGLGLAAAFWMSGLRRPTVAPHRATAAVPAAREPPAHFMKR